MLIFVTIICKAGKILGCIYMYMYVVIYFLVPATTQVLFLDDHQQRWKNTLVYMCVCMYLYVCTSIHSKKTNFSGNIKGSLS